MSDGQLAMNTNLASPGLFFKDSNGDLVKTGPVHVGTTAPNATPASGGQAGNSKGELWLDTSGSDYSLKTWDGSAWRVGVTAIGSGVIVDADIDASAAIAGTKISPDFGSQNVVTTGNVNAGSINNSTLLNYVYYTTAGSGTYTPTTGAKRILVEVWGGGGGGGGVNGQGANTWGKGAGGGGGGYCSKWLASTLDASYSYTVGAGGNGGTAGANSGAVGGDSTFSGTGVSLTAIGGGAGSGATGSAGGNNTSGAAGGNATGGDINIKGGVSESITTTAATMRTGTTGSGYSFPQANWVGGLSPSSGFAGQQAFNPAEGGGGAGSRDIATNFAGGAGGPGLIKITEYFV
jgi:hypothetical protein